MVLRSVTVVTICYGRAMKPGYSPVPLGKGARSTNAVTFARVEGHVPSTKGISHTSGLFQGDCSCKRHVTLELGDSFPHCDGCGRAITWSRIPRPAKRFRRRHAVRQVRLSSLWNGLVERFRGPRMADADQWI
jgi:hypothetical protein